MVRAARWRVADVIRRVADLIAYGSAWPLCRECWFKRSSGRHKSVAVCSALMAHPCANPEEHHRYRMFGW